MPTIGFVGDPESEAEKSRPDRPSSGHTPDGKRIISFGESAYPCIG